MAEDRVAFDKAVKVIGGHKAQITIAAEKLQQVAQKGEIAVGELSAVKAAKVMVEKQVGKIELVSDNLLGNEFYTEKALQDLTVYLLKVGDLCEMVSTIINKSGGGSKGDATVLDTSGLENALANINIRQPLSASDLPSFNGNPSEYVPFIESFDFLVNVEGIPDAMKAMYLKRCIKERGPDGKPNSAYDLLKHITPTGDSYQLMRDKLEKRFKLTYLNKAEYLSNLRKLSSWKPCISGTEVRKLLDYITENIDLLELCGGNSVNESEFLLSDILSLMVAGLDEGPHHKV